MPIEFRCTSCFKLLRTPDESVGKKAKCPQCGSVVDVPSGSDGKDFEVPDGDVPRDPFAQSTAPTRDEDATFNPYSAPETIAQPFAPEPSLEGLQHTTIGFDDVLRRSFELTKSQLGPVALCGLVSLGIYVGVSMVSGVIGVSLEGAGQVLGQPALQILGQVVQQGIGFLVNTFFELALINVGLRLARTGTVEISDLFNVSHLYGRGLAINFLRAVLMFAVVLVFVAPAAASLFLEEVTMIVVAFVVAMIPAMIMATYVYYRLYLVLFFLVDRNLGVIECLRASDHFMTSNKMTTFLVVLVVGLLSGAVVLFTLCVGMVVVWPFGGILSATIYLLATGQPVHRPLTAN